MGIVKRKYQLFQSSLENGYFPGKFLPCLSSIPDGWGVLPPPCAQPFLRNIGGNRSFGRFPVPGILLRAVEIFLPDQGISLGPCNVPRDSDQFHDKPVL